MILIVLLAHVIYSMPYPGQPISFFVFVSLGVLAFRALGSIIASVVNSMQESQILIQILYFPMLLLSGATIPLAVMPIWLQIVAQFIPSTYLATGLQGILLGQETLYDNLTAVAALVLTTVVGTFLGAEIVPLGKRRKDARIGKVVGAGGAGSFRIDGHVAGVCEKQSGEGPDPGARFATAAQLADPGRAPVSGRWIGDRSRIGAGSQRARSSRSLREMLPTPRR